MILTALRRKLSEHSEATARLQLVPESIVEREDANLPTPDENPEKTGEYHEGRHFCSYQPDPEFPIAWEFGAATIEPDSQTPINLGEGANQ